MKLVLNNKKFPPLNGKIFLYGRRVIKTHYYYIYDYKLEKIIVAVIRTPCSCNSC